jgi:MFS family permease
MAFSPYALLNEVGLITLYRSSRDTKLLCLQRFVRVFAYGGTTLILVQFLKLLGNSDQRIGLFMTLTLIGDVIISFFLALFADHLGRRVILASGSLLMVASGVTFATSSNYVVILLAAIIGVICPKYVFQAGNKF